MVRIVHILLVVCMVAGGITWQSVDAAQSEELIDLANVPMPIQDLPETGYQILAGDYLSLSDAVTMIADPRNLDVGQVRSNLDSLGLSRTYVLDLVLPEDRAWQDSPVLAVQQTSVYVLDEESNADLLVGMLTDYSATSYVSGHDPAVDGAHTVGLIGEGGDMLRTVVADGGVVIEIVSLDATGAPDESEHIQIVQGTLQRLRDARDSGNAGLSSMTMTLAAGDDSATFAHTQQTGVHGLYRVRDGVMQPAIGELNVDETTLPAGLQGLYVSSDISRTGSGNAVVSTWLGEFDSEDSANTAFEVLVSGSPAELLADPYFAMDEEETWTEQGVVGLYRVTGAYEGARYSGTVEIRVVGDKIVVVGYRSIGAALPAADITSALMDHQLTCIEAAQICSPFDLVAMLPPADANPQATPVADSALISSDEFGWSLPELGPEWSVTERFVEPGYDRVSLQNGVSMFEFESVINHHGEPVQCVLDELHMLELFEEHSDIRLWEDANGNTVGGNNANQAWVVYRVEPLAEERADQEYVIRIDCFVLIEGSANLVMTQIAPVDVWVTEAPKGDELRDGLTIPEAIGPHDMLVLTAHKRRMDMIHTHWIDRAA